MNLISIILKNIRNFLPYFLLIAIYFFFVNLEARKESNKSKNIKNEINKPKNGSTIDNKDYRIIIPVIPYKK